MGHEPLTKWDDPPTAFLMNWIVESAAELAQKLSFILKHKSLFLGPCWWEYKQLIYSRS